MLSPGSTGSLGRFLVLLALAISAAMLAGCRGGDESSLDDTAEQAEVDSAGAAPADAVAAGAGNDQPGSDPPGDRPTPKREVRLALTDWTGSRINLAIAELLIERNLGYPVTATPVGDIQSMLTELESGELDAVLELWPSSLSESEQAFFDSGRVENLGPLGVEGEVGWYVPRYVVEDDPDLVSWEGFAGSDVARRFASIETGSQGRFLGTNPGYEQFDEDLIVALDLDFEVVYSGSEVATRSELSTATAALRPIVLYWWSPTAEVVEFDLVKVELPPRTPECLDAHAAGGRMSCGYPVESLFKAGYPGLVDSDPALYAFLERFSLTTAEQTQMIWDVEHEQRSIADVAAQWVDDNRARWTPWLGADGG